MKNLKLFGIVMMLVMGMSFTSCSSDDDEGPSSGSIEENIEGEWFLVSEKEVCSELGTSYTNWDYDNQTAYGYCSGEENCAHEPEKLYIECVGENTYEVIWAYFSNSSGSWKFEEEGVLEFDGNVIYEGTEENSGGVYYEKIYIKSVSAKELVVVGEEKDVYEDGEVHNCVTTCTYRRNN